MIKAIKQFFNPQKLPISDQLVIETQDTIIVIQPDPVSMSPIKAARLQVMISRPHANWDYADYVKRHGLQAHVTIKEKS